MEGIKDVVQVSIKTNERDIDFISFSGLNQIKQNIDGDVTSVVLTDEELELIVCSKEPKGIEAFVHSVLKMNKAV
ncbi:TPA: cytoplasmic protein [Bacillus cytotoxicus]|nr:cytoplasmic protein [Bacillus cytotoxicus]HDR7866118.1 cytoplasmic protein [Bacillus cytotoxicus]